MPLITVVIILIVIGVLLYLFNIYVSPYVDAKFVKLINIVVVLAVIIWLLKVFGVWGYASKVTVG